MTPRPVRRLRSDTGSAALPLVVAAALALVVFVILANVVVLVHTRQAVRAATDEAARAGSRADAPVDACVARARAVLEGLLGPGARAGARVSCAVSGTPPAVHASVAADLVPWLPGLPTMSFTVDGRAVQEVLP